MKKLFFFIIAVFLIQGKPLIGQGFEKIHPGSSPNIIQLNDSSVLCVAGDSIYSINQTDGNVQWKKSNFGCFNKVVEGKNDEFFLLGMSSCNWTGGAYPDFIVNKINNIGDTIWSQNLGDGHSFHNLGVYFNEILYFGYYNSIEQLSYLIGMDSNGTIMDTVSLGVNRPLAISNDNQDIIIALHGSISSQNDSAFFLRIDSNMIVTSSIGIDSVDYFISKIDFVDSNYIVLAGKLLLTINESTGIKQLSRRFDSTYYLDFTIVNDSVIGLVGNHYFEDISVTTYDILNDSLVNNKRFGSYRFKDKGYDILLVDGNELIISGRTEYKDWNSRAYIFKVSQNLTSTNCSDSLDILNVQSYCLGDTVHLLNNSFGLGKLYTWEVMGDTFTNYTVNQPFSFFADSIGILEVKLSSCQDSISTNIIIKDTLIPSFTFDSYGDSLVFYSPAGFGNLVSFWDFGDGNYSYDSIAHHVYADTGNYVVTLNFIYGNCYSNQNKIVSINNSLSIKKTGLKNTIKVYPNPSNNGVFRIESNIQNSKLQVYNYSGMIIPFIYQNNQIKILNPVAGIYYLKITSKIGETIQQKLIINK